VRSVRSRAWTTRARIAAECSPFGARSIHHGGVVALRYGCRYGRAGDEIFCRVLLTSSGLQVHAFTESRRATGTGVHRGNQSKPRRIGKAGSGTSDGDMSVLHRLTHHLQNIPIELRNSSRKSTPLWARPTSPGLGMEPPPRQASIRDRVMRGAEGAPVTRDAPLGSSPVTLYSFILPAALRV